MKHNEDALQMLVVEYLNLLPNLIFAYHVKNSGKKSIQSAVRDKKLGVISGVPDLVIEWATGHGYIELKAGKGVLSESQKGFRDLCKRWGKNWALCRSVDEVVATLRLWGAI